MITTILFDWAGVLTTGRYTQAILDELIKKKNISINKIYDDFDALILEMMKGKLTFFKFVSKVNDDFALNIDEKEMKDVFNKAINPNHSTIEFAKSLVPNYRLVLLSDNDATTVENLQNHHLDTLNIFEKKYFSFNLGFTKPDSRIYEYVLKDLGVRPSECLFIDDKSKNIDGAKQIGMNAIQFIDMEQLKKDFVKLGINRN